jgi:hypothetical protein
VKILEPLGIIVVSMSAVEPVIFVSSQEQFVRETLPRIVALSATIYVVFSIG